MSKRIMRRRDFLKAAAVAPVVNTIGCCCTGGTAAATAPRTESSGGVAKITGMSRASEPPQSRVVLIRDAKAVVFIRDEKGAVKERKFNADVIQKMLDEAVMALFGEKTPAAAWTRIVTPADTVGIKTNAWNYLPTGKEVEQAIQTRVLEAGVPAAKVAVADRGVLTNPVS